MKNLNFPAILGRILKTLMIAIKTPNFYAAMKLTLQAKFTYRTGTNFTYKSLYTSEL